LQTTAVTPADDDEEYRKLQLAAFSFLTELSRVKEHRTNFFSMQDLLDASAALLAKSEPLSLQHASVKFLCALAPYAADTASEHFPASKFSLVFSSRISLEGSKSKKIKRSGFVTNKKVSTRKIDPDQLDINENYVCALAVSGLKCLYHGITSEDQLSVAKLLSSQFARLVDIASFSAKNKYRSDRGPHEHSGVLAYNIMEILVTLTRSPACREEVLSDRLVSAMLRLIILSDLIEGRKDDINDDELYWNATLTQCLQCVSSLTCSQGSETSLGRTWLEVISDAETTAGEVKSKKRDSRQFPSMQRANSGIEDGSSSTTTFRGALILIMEKRSCAINVTAARSILRQTC
jgi:hypothetical protein